MLRSEFRRRLSRADRAIDRTLISGRIVGDLLPSLFSLFSYLWCRTTKSQLMYDREKPTLDF